MVQTTLLMAARCLPFDRAFCNRYLSIVPQSQTVLSIVGALFLISRRAGCICSLPVASVPDLNLSCEGLCAILSKNGQCFVHKHSNQPTPKSPFIDKFSWVARSCQPAVFVSGLSASNTAK